MTRRARYCRLILGIIALLPAVSTGTRGDAQQDARAVTVDIGSAEGSPGSAVTVAVIVSAPKDAPISGFEQDIRFEKQWLSYVGAEPSEEATDIDLAVAASAAPDPSDEAYSRVRLKATSARPLPNGVLVNVTFSIAEAVEPGARTVLQNKPRIQRPGRDAMSDATGKDGEITVTEGIVIPACFFYMH